MRIAVMQPYFLPYIGYFGLFCHADLVVFFDCVQFPARGWVHRNRFYNTKKELSWFTLPIMKKERFQLIHSLEFSHDAHEALLAQKNRFPIFKSASVSDLCSFILTPQNTVKEYLARSLAMCCQLISLPFNTVFSSTFPISPDIHGEERIIALCKALGAKEYINLPGGRSLYNEQRFKQDNIKLSFLPAIDGTHPSIIELMEQQSMSDLRKFIYAQLPIPC